MKEIALEELKALQLDILIAVDKFCKENGIDYTLYYGTLLGAIRHKGYIPWDDDIDIAMPRPSYERFVKSFNGTFQNLYVISPEINLDYYAPYANVCDNRTILYEGRNGHRGIEVGVKIDIFPIDAVPDSLAEQQSIEKKLLWTQKIMAVKSRTFSFRNIKELVWLLFYKTVTFFQSYKSYQYRIKDIVKAYDWEKSKYVAQIVIPFSGIKVFPRSYLNNYIDVYFEERTFKAIKEFDSYLHLQYGNYMELPPEEQRICLHGFKAYWKE